jgi:hypothetical protein
MTSSSMSSASLSIELRIDVGGATNTWDAAAAGVDALEAVALDFLGFFGVAVTAAGGGTMTGTGMVILGTGIVAGGGIGSGV